MSKYKDAQMEKLDEGFMKIYQQAIDEKKGIFLHGDTGVGKTYAMYAIAKNKKAKVDNFPKLLVEFRDYMQRGCYHDRIKDYVDQDYLFIDDLGAEKMSEYVAEFIYILVNERYMNQKRTVLSTNLSLEEFEERDGDRILSRIGEMCVMYSMEGEDRRI